MKSKDAANEFERTRGQDPDVFEKLNNVIDPDETYWKNDSQLIIINKNEEDLSFLCQYKEPIFEVIEKKSQDELQKEGFVKISFEEVWRLIVGGKMGSNGSIRQAINEFLLEWERYFH